jgi:hypothetical protein
MAAGISSTITNRREGLRAKVDALQQIFQGCVMTDADFLNTNYPIDRTKNDVDQYITADDQHIERKPVGCYQEMKHTKMVKETKACFLHIQTTILIEKSIWLMVRPIPES